MKQDLDPNRSFDQSPISQISQRPKQIDTFQDMVEAISVILDDRTDTFFPRYLSLNNDTEPFYENYFSISTATQLPPPSFDRVTDKS